MEERILLYDLFDQVRKDSQWASPGLEEYYLFLDLLDNPDFRIRSFDHLSFIFETLWLKSHKQRDRFRKMLEERRSYLSDLAEKAASEIKKADASDAANGKDNNNKPAQAAAGSNSNSGNHKTDSGNSSDPANNGNNNNNSTDANNETKPADTTGNSPDLSASEPGFSISNDLTDSGKTLKLTRKETEESKPVVEIPYIFTNDYFPVKSRQLQQTWRGLKNKQDGPEANSINIEKTIRLFSEKGYFSGFAFDKSVVNQVQLFIFLDDSESMIAEEEFGEELINSARASELHPNLQSWYFNKVPSFDPEKGDYTIINKEWTKSITLRKLFSKYNKKDIVVLIYSDAGALFEGYDNERLEQTRRFITDLYQRTAYLAWLNPAPKSRWNKSIAGVLSEEAVPMFETDRSDVENAITALKGKLTIQ